MENEKSFMSGNIILDKSFSFALRIVKLYHYLSEEKHENVLSKQLLNAGTYIGKHIKEATAAESKTIYTQEMGFALRKASETEYWLELLHKAGFLSDKQFESINQDRDEIFLMLTKIVKTSKSQAE
jgi:four helix bundle protein